MADEQSLPERQLQLQSLYIKNFSFESPMTPAIFASDVDGESLLEINSISREMGEDDVEVTLTVNIKVTAKEDTLFSIELEQAGVFTIKGYAPEERFRLLGGKCPGTLYPFAREAVADIAKRGGFPQLLLQAIDFDALFAEKMRERAAARAEQTQAAGTATGSDAETTQMNPRDSVSSNSS